MPSPSFRAHSATSGRIAFAGTDAMSLLAATIELLHHLLPEPPHYSPDFVKESILDWLRQIRLGAKPATGDDVRSLIDRLSNTKPTDHRVFRAVYGASLNDTPTPLTIGPCALYSTRTHRNAAISDGALEEHTEQWLNSVDVLAEVQVKAVEPKAAYALADSMFAHVEAFVALTEPQDREYRRVSILSEHANYWRPSLIRTSDTVHLSSENLGPVDCLPLDNAAFTSPVPAMARLWQLLTVPHPNEWEARLVRSAKWLGDAIACRDADVAIVRMTTALESLLYVNNHGPYAPSRTASLSEAAAHIIGSSVEHCLEVESHVRQLYDARSKVVHSGDAGLSKLQLASMLKMTREILFTLLADKDWRAITSAQHFYEALRRSRYAHRKYFPGSSRSA